MKKLIMASAFILAIGAVLTSNAKSMKFALTGYTKPGGICTMGNVDQSSCPGGSAFCTISGVHPVYDNLTDCQNTRNVLSFNP